MNDWYFSDKGLIQPLLSGSLHISFLERILIFHLISLAFNILLCLFRAAE